MLLPGTYNGLLCRALLDARDFDVAALVSWLRRIATPTACFAFRECGPMTCSSSPIRGELAICRLSPDELRARGDRDARAWPCPADYRPFLDPLRLKAWLAERDLRDPWQEGNNIVNLGSFLLLLRRR